MADPKPEPEWRRRARQRRALREAQAAEQARQAETLTVRRITIEKRKAPE